MRLPSELKMIGVTRCILLEAAEHDTLIELQKQ